MRAEHVSKALIWAEEVIGFCSSWQLSMRAEHASTALICAVEMTVFFQLLAALNASGACF